MYTRELYVHMHSKEKQNQIRYLSNKSKQHKDNILLFWNNRLKLCLCTIL